MNIDEIKRKLEQEINENNSKIAELDLKIKTLNANLIEMKKGLAISYGAFPFIVLLPSVIFWGKYVPVSLIPTIIFGVPALIGIGLTKITTKVNKIKERLEAFSKAKKAKEIREEITKYEIEKAKILNDNVLIQNVYHSIDIKDEYDMVKRKLLTLGFTLEDIKAPELDEKHSEEVLQEQQMLNDYKQHINKLTEDYNLALNNTVNKNKIFIGIETSLGCGLAVDTVSALYFSLGRELIGLPASFINNNLLVTLAPGILVTLVGSIFTIKRYFDCKNANKKVAESLGSDVLKSEDIYSEQIKLESLLQTIIKKASEVRVKYELENATLKHLQKEPESVEERLSYSEEEIKEYMKLMEEPDLLQTPEGIAATYDEEGPTRKRRKNKE